MPSPSLGSQKQTKFAPLLANPTLHKSIRQLHYDYIDTIHPADFVASYFLLLCSYTNPNGFIQKAHATQPDSQPHTAYPRSQVWSYSHKRTINPSEDPPPFTLSKIPNLKLSPRDASRFPPTTPVIEIFQQCHLSPLPFYVNTCLVNWRLNCRPIILLTRLATPTELQAMQAIGLRCLTLFCTPASLVATHADFYPPYAVKDALHFAVHDLQHLEKFVNEVYYMEQVGFLHRMEAVRAFVKEGGGKQIRFDVGHVIADMNTNVIHLLDFLKAKWSLATEFDTVDFKNVVGMLMPDFEGDEMSVDDVRTYFQAVGKARVGEEVGKHWPFTVPAESLFFRGKGLLT